MIRNVFTRIIFVTIICCSGFISRAQVGYNYAQYDIGFGAGLNVLFGDIATIKVTPQANFSFNYNQTPYVNYIFEAQGGQLGGGDSVKNRYGRQSSGSYGAFIFRGQVQIGEIVDYSQSPVANFFKNVYLSAGIGYLANHITNINRRSLYVPDFYTGGENNSSEVFIPTRLGYEFKIFNQYDQPSVKIDIAYQYNFVMSDELDGFTAGHSKDGFQQVTLGVKFALGSLTSYRKQISF